MPLQDTARAQHSHTTTRALLTRRVAPVALAAALATVVGLSLSGTVAASNDDGLRACTLATLKGRYLFADAGTLYPPAFGVAQPTPAANAGFHLFNGDGTGTDTVTFRVGGVIMLENVVAPRQLHGECGLYGHALSARWTIVWHVRLARWRGDRVNRDGSRQLCGEHRSAGISQIAESSTDWRRVPGVRPEHS